MKHKVTIMVEREKQGLFGKKKVLEPRTVKVDSKTYRKIQNERRKQSYSMEELMLYDAILNEWDF